MEPLGTLSGEIAHDFNNLLYSIILNASLLLQKCEADSVDGSCDFTSTAFEAIRFMRAAFSETNSIEQNLHGVEIPVFSTRGSEHAMALELSTVFGIVHRHGGGICVASKPGIGITMAILLPHFDDLTDKSHGHNSRYLEYHQSHQENVVAANTTIGTDSLFG